MPIGYMCECGCGNEAGNCRMEPRAERWRYNPQCGCKRAVSQLKQKQAETLARRYAIAVAELRIQEKICAKTRRDLARIGYDEFGVKRK